MRSGKGWSRATLLICIGWLCAPLAAPLPARGENANFVRRLTVHEWGTFTSLQDETGRSIGGINADDEPVPPFVHTLRWDLIVGTLSQGVPRCHPDVTMRLETPVMYFHLPPGTTSATLDVSAEFHGGWLSQFFPYAMAHAPGLGKEGVMTPGSITRNTTGSLEWNEIKVSAEVDAATVPPSDEHV